MTEYNFYIVFMRTPESRTMADIVDVMNKCKDWYRLSPETWLVYSSRDANGLYRRFSELVQPGGQLFISRLDVTDRQGFINNTVWQWIRDLQQHRPVAAE